MPIRPLLEENPGAFGPEDIQAIVAAFEALLKDFGLTDRTDPATMMLARLTFEIAHQGKFDAASLRARVLEVMKTNGRPLMRGLLRLSFFTDERYDQ